MVNLVGSRQTTDREALPSEYLHDFRFATRNMARKEILEYITFYNADRLHSSLGYVSPMEYERLQWMKAA